MRIKIFGLFFLALVVFLSFHERSKLGQTGTAFNPVRLYLMPLKGEAVFEENAPVLENFIETTAGLQVEMIHAPDFITIIKAFNAGAADAAFMNTLGYLMARDWTKVQAHLKVLYGNGQSFYKGAIIALSTGRIDSLADLQGKKVAFPDPFSASGYLYALKLFEESQIQPAQIIFANGHLDAIEKVYRGEVDAAASYYEDPDPNGLPRDARATLKEKYPDVFEKLKIIALTEEIPTGPIAIRQDLAPPIQTKLVGSLLEFARTEEGKKVLENLYNVTGLALTQNSDYDGVQKTLKQLGKRSEELVPGGLSFYRTQIAEPGLAY